MKKNYFSFLLALASVFSFSANAQQKLAKELVIVNGGSKKVSAYNPHTKNYQDFGSFTATSTQDVIIHGKYAYVAVVDSIMKYDLVTDARVAAAKCAGVTEFAVYKDKLVVVKGFGASSNYVELRKLSDLSIQKNFSSVAAQCSDVAILKDTAYVSMPGAWGTAIGRVAIINLKGNAYVRTDTLGASGKGIGRIFVAKNKVYSISDHGWGATDYSIHTYDNAAKTWTNNALQGKVSGYTGACVRTDTLYLAIGDTTKLMNLQNFSIINNNFTTKKLSALIYDDVTNKFYGTKQSFTANGQAYIFNTNGTIADSFAVGKAAEAIAMAYNYVPLAKNDKKILVKNTNHEFANQDNDVDKDGAMTFSIVKAPVNGTATVVFGNHALYKPNANFIGKDSLQYKVTDVWGDADSAWAIVDVVNEFETKVVTFEDFGLGTDKYYNGADDWGGFVANGAFFNNKFNPKWKSWSGFSYSTKNDATTAGFTNQYSTVAGGGAKGSSTFGLANGGKGKIIVNSTKDQLINGVFLTNSTYAALSMKNGDSIAKKFGGTSGNDPDFFKIRFYGVNKAGTITDSVDFYLADYRFSDNTKDYIVTNWKYVDLKKLGKVVEIRYHLTSSDNGSFGMYTPAYFCLDNLNDFPVSVSETVVNRNEWKVFPNPTRDILNVFSGKNVDKSIVVEVYDLQGKQVRQTNVTATYTTLDISELPTGIYTIAIHDGKSVEIHKIVKQ